MAFNGIKGTLTQPGATGNVTISLGSNFDPRVIIMWGVSLAAAGDSLSSAPSEFSFGVGTYRSGVVSQWYLNHAAESADQTAVHALPDAGTGSLLRLYGNNNLDVVPATIDCEIDLVSMSTGATSNVIINWANLHTTASIVIHYIILGGSDVSDALCGAKTGGNTTTEDITVATGFGQPDLLCIGSDWNAPGQVDNAFVQNSIGWGYDNLNMVVSNFGILDGNTAVIAGSFQATGKILQTVGVTPSLDYDAVLAAKANWPTDGFRLTLSSGTTDTIFWLALKGTFQKALGQETTPTTTGNKDTAVGFPPKCVLMWGNSIPSNAALDTTHADLGHFWVGGSDGTFDGAAGWNDDDANANQRGRMRHSITRSLDMCSNAAGTITTVAQAVTAWVSSGNNMRLNYTTAPAAARAFCYVVFGDAAETGTSKSDTDTNGTTTEVASVAIAVTDANGAATEATALAATAADSDANGATTEVLSVRIVPVSAETGTIAEAQAVTVPIASSDANGATTEITTLLVALATSDVGTDSETAAIRIIVADANGVVTESQTVTVPIASSDTNGATTETQALTASLSTSDANGSTAESATLVVTISATDANGTVTEVASLVVTLSASDTNGVTVEVGSIRISVSDANGSTIEATLLAAQLTTTDTNSTTTENASTNTFKNGGIDTGSITENNTIVALITATDSGTDTETASPQATPTSTDANGATTEIGSKAVSSTSSDSGTATEGQSLLARPTASDAGTAVEIATLLARMTTTDAGTDSESGSAKATIFTADSGSSSEAAQILQAYVTSDTNGPTTENGVIAAQLTSQDIGTLIEGWIVFKSGFGDVAGGMLLAAAYEKARLVQVGEPDAEMESVVYDKPRITKAR